MRDDSPPPDGRDPPVISKRVQGFTECVIREMTRVNDLHGGINLAQGMPNFPPPRELIDAHRAIDGDFHQYPITWGAEPLRRAVADKYRRWHGMDVDADLHVTVCCFPKTDDLLIEAGRRLQKLAR